jgi:hypothetical protein
VTDDAVRRALRSAIRNAVDMGRKGGQGRLLDDAFRYAELLVLPIVAARVEQAVEDGFAAAQRAAPGPALSTGGA